MTPVEQQLRTARIALQRLARKTRRGELHLTTHEGRALAQRTLEQMNEPEPEEER